MTQIEYEIPRPDGAGRYHYTSFTSGPAQPEQHEIRLARWRKVRGLTQRDLAKKAGVALTTINEIETGKRTPRPATLRQIAGALQLQDWELHNDPSDEDEAVIQVLRAVNQLDNAFTSAQIDGLDGRGFAHRYRYFLDLHGGEYEGDNGLDVWTALGGTVLASLFGFWQELGRLLEEQADDQTRAEMQFALSHWLPEMECAGVTFAGRERLAQSSN